MVKTAIFLCGAAGAGKTTMRTHFLHDIGFHSPHVVLDIDEVYRKVRTVEGFHELVRETIQRGKSFVYDKTCKKEHEVMELVHYAKQRGYKVIFGIVYAPLAVILKRLKMRKHQPLSASVARKIYDDVEKVAEQYMHKQDIDEIYLYNETLILRKIKDKIDCVHKDSNFYFDISKYC